jgi:hypothetical protein
MLAPSWTKPIGETPKVLFVDLVEDCDYGLLNYFVLQGRNSQWPLLAISFRYPVSLRWLRLLGAAVHPAQAHYLPVATRQHTRKTHPRLAISTLVCSQRVSKGTNHAVTELERQDLFPLRVEIDPSFFQIRDIP